MAWHVMRFTIAILFIAQLWFLLPTYTIPPTVPMVASTNSYAIASRGDNAKVIEGKGRVRGGEVGMIGAVGKNRGGMRTAGILLDDR